MNALKPRLMEEELADAIEDVALQGLKAMRAYLAYQGTNGDYLKKAKIGAAALGAYTRLRATMANERALVLMTERQQKALKE